MTIYRCSVCGKWSHAKAKPKFHQRLVTDEGQDDPAEVIRYEEGFTDYQSGEGWDGGWWIRCGPFDTYEAVKVA